jgi:CRISPR-associated endonuclease Csn1
MTEAQATEFVSGFVQRQLNDTRYASKLAAKFVGMLYGGKADEEHTMRVGVTSGEVTAQLRRAWQLNSILSDGPTSGGGEVLKTRDDHRHHAVDAVAIALTDDGTIQRLSRAAQTSRAQGRRGPGSLQGPWPNFADSVRQEISRIVVSHRVSKKVSGALHEETNYSSPSPDGRRHVRKPVEALTKGEVEQIVDRRVQALVQEKLTEVGGNPKKLKGNFPCFVIEGGRRIPIKSVRIEKKLPTEPVGHGRTTRYVASESNHHVEIYAERKPDGTEGQWDGEVVPMAEAYRRQKEGKPIVNSDHGPLTQFKFSLAPGEIVECDRAHGQRGLLVVRSFSQLSAGSIQIGLVPLTDARLKKDIVSSGGFIRPGPNVLRQWHARKVAVSPLGEVIKSHD